MGILPGGVTLEARSDMQFEALNPLTGAVVSKATLLAGKTMTLSPTQGLSAYITRKTAKKDITVPTLEVTYPFFKDDPKVMTEVMRQVKQPCLGFKSWVPDGFVRVSKRCQRLSNSPSRISSLPMG